MSSTRFVERFAPEASKAPCRERTRPAILCSQTIQGCPFNSGMRRFRTLEHALQRQLTVAETRPSSHAHLTSDEVAMYLDARMSELDRRRVDTHLADCDVCRDEVLEVRSMLRSAPRRSRARAPISAIVGAVAAALVLAVAPWKYARQSRSDLESQVATERAVLPDAGRDSVQIVAPAVDATVARRAMFVWRRGVGDSQFTVTVMNERGDVAWSASTRDSVMTLPDGVPLIPGMAYVLYVDALRDDGTSARSGPRLFTIQP